MLKKILHYVSSREFSMFELAGVVFLVNYSIKNHKGFSFFFIFWLALYLTNLMIRVFSETEEVPEDV